MQKKQSDLFLLSQARGVLMGIATLWVLLFHSYQLDFSHSQLLCRTGLAPWLNALRNMGAGGVDVFLLLSGFGLYFSFSRDGRVLPFYARRFSHILPPVLIVSFVYYGFVGADGLFDYLGKTLLFGFFHPTLERGVHWYFSLLAVLYLLYPALHRLIDRFGGRGALAVGGGSIALAFAMLRLCPDYLLKIQFAVTRIPVFTAGVWLGRKAMRRESVPSFVMWGALPALALFIAARRFISLPWPYTFAEFYLYLPIALALALGVSAVCGALRVGPVRRALTLLGSYSLEIYLLYEILYLHLGPFMHSADGVGLSRVLAVSVLTAALSVLLRRLCAALSQAYKKAGD